MAGILLSVPMATALVSFAGCGARVEGVGIGLSEKERVTSPHVAPSNLTDLIDGNSVAAP